MSNNVRIKADSGAYPRPTASTNKVEFITPRSKQLLGYSLLSLAKVQLGKGYAVAVHPVDYSSETMKHIALSPALRKAGSRRRATFRAGRMCALEALEALGSKAPEIPVGVSGAPVWPEGFIGSISHTDYFAAAVLAKNPPFSGLGIDIEDDAPLDDANMVQLVCRLEEMLDDSNPADPDNLIRGKLLFVVKESIYKLHQPLGGAFLDFHDLSVSLDLFTKKFTAELVDPCKQGSAGRIIKGHFSHENGYFLAISSCLR